MSKRHKTLYIKPLKLFSHKDTVYLHARFAVTPGKPYQKPEFDPLLAIHRLKAVEITVKIFEFPEKYDFDSTFKHNFGVMKDDDFEGYRIQRMGG